MKKHLLIPVTILFVITASLCQAQIFYGMTPYGGAYSFGAIISFNANGNSENVLWSFGSGKDGKTPEGNLVYDTSNGLFYGMTANGGSDSLGAIFSFNPSTNKDSVLWSFAGFPSDASYPYGDLVYDANKGLFYGMTYGGGTTNIGYYGGGTIFSFNPSTNTDSVVWNFAGPPSDGAFPNGDLVYDANNGLFYGMTQGGSNSSYTYSGAGAIISFNPSTNKDSLLWSFGSGTDGSVPERNLIYDVNNKLFYGMTRSGGNKDTANGGFGDGTIISFNPTGNSESVVWNLAGTPSDGAGAGGSLVYDTVNELFYGMTGGGGTNSVGTIISFNPTGNSENVVWSFGKGTDGEAPIGDLVYDASNGLFYGMTQWGGADSLGAIISFNPTATSNAESVLWNFGSGKDGFNPYGNLVIYPPSVGAGINQLTVDRGQLTVYPNPTSGQFTVNLNNNQIGNTVEVYNIMGERVYQSVLSNLQNTISLSDEPDGMYFVYLKSGEGVEIGKELITR